MIKNDLVGKWYTFKAKSELEAELLLYDEIGESFFGGGVSAKQFAEDLKAVKDAKVLNVRINSPGGSVFDGTAIYNQLTRFRGRVEVDIDGLAASIASVIALAGRPVRMAANALYMIHNPSGMVVGNAQDMRQMADVLDTVQSTIVSVYADHTTQSEKDLTKWMAAETWMTAAEAKERGFIDEITGAVAVTNKFDLSKFKHPPQLAPPLVHAGLDSNLQARLAHMAQRVRQLRSV